MSKPVRCLIVAPAPLSDDWPGGISNFIRSFVRNMPDDFAVAVAGVAPRGEPVDGRWRHDVVAGRDIQFMAVAGLADGGALSRVPVKARAMWGLLRARPKLPAAGAVIQVHAPAMDLPLVMRRTPIIRVVHNSPDNLAARSVGSQWRRSAWALRRIEEADFRRADRVFFVDRATYDRYQRAETGTDGRLSYMSNGVDTDTFAPRDALERKLARHRLASRLDIPERGPWLLFCGRLDRQKDPDLLIATFARARLLAGLHDAQLVVVGAGPLLEHARQQARSAGVDAATHFVGRLDNDELPEMMAAADALLLTSAFEAAPFVVLEALACGLPVVATDVGDVAQVVQHQHTGWVAAQRSADELARGVAWVVSESRDEIGARAAASMAEYRISDVLEPLYAAHRALADTSGR